VVQPSLQMHSQREKSSRKVTPTILQLLLLIYSFQYRSAFCRQYGAQYRKSQSDVRGPQSGW